MLRTVINKLVGSVAAIFGASIISFVFLRVLPGNPARLIVGPLAPASSLLSVEKQMGLDQPVIVQYGRYMTSFLRGDWGFSYGAGVPVTTEMASRLPASLELGFYAFLLAFVAAVICALLATYRYRPVTDGVVRGTAFFGLSVPPFWFGLLALLLFFATWGILPGPEGRLSTSTTPPPSITHFYTIDALLHGQLSTFVDAVRHLILPAITLGLAPFSYLVRLLRANLLDVSREPFIIVVRSKGIGRFLAFARHALPNAFLPTLTAAGLVLAQLLSGSVLVEKVFNWPGVGALVTDSILRQDNAIVQTFILLSATAYVVVNLVVDILYGVIDPRVRIS
ncbi:MAG: transporter permease [Chloroflexi bacterium]|nr:transporter permease [Chloroflexota bacterium]MDB5076250.1 transporter permease [Chloroflexota bacterium]